MKFFRLLLLLQLPCIIVNAQFGELMPVHEGFDTFNGAFALDLNQNGDTEIVTFVDDELRVYKAYQGDQLRYYLHQSTNFIGEEDAPIWGVDLNEDNYKDLLTIQNSTLFWFEYDPNTDQILEPQSILTLNAAPTQTMEVDLNPSAPFEALILEGGNLSLLEISVDLASPQATISTIDGISDVSVFGWGDIDLDNNEDLITFGNNTVKWAPRINDDPLEFGAEVLVDNDISGILQLGAGFIDNSAAVDIWAAQTYVAGGLPDNRAFYYKGTDLNGTTWSNPKNMVNADGRMEGIEFIDLDEDGDLDLLIDDADAGPSFSEVEDFEYMPPIRLFPVQDNSELYKGDIELFEDLNGDGKPDILFSRISTFAITPSTTLRWYSNDFLNSGLFQPSPMITHNLRNIYEMNAGDFDQDGDLDIVGAYGRNYNGWPPYDERIIIYEYLADLNTYTISTSQNYYPTSDGSEPYYRASGEFIDIDEDGDLDVLYQINWVIGWLENLDGEGTMSSPQIIGTIGSNNNSFFGILLDDFNNDGLLDIAAEDRLFINQPNSSAFTYVDANPGSNNYKWFATIDFEGDGDRDLILSRNNSNLNGANVIFNMDGMGTTWDTEIAPSPDIYEYTSLFEFETIDIDGDGDEDIIYKDAFASTFPDFYIFENLGAGNYTVEPSLVAEYPLFGIDDSGSGGSGVTEIYVADFNGDGLDDFLSGKNGVNNQFIFLNTPGQLLMPPPIMVAPSDFIVTMGVQDMDEDGNPDVLAKDLGRTGDLVWSRNKINDGPFDLPVVIPYIVYADIDSSQTYNPQIDDLYPNASVRIVDQNVQGFSGDSGIGTLLLEDEGIYTLALDVPNGFEQTSLPVEYEINTDTLGQQVYEFGIYTPQFAYDGAITYNFGIPRCEQPVNHVFKAINEGTKPVDIWIKACFTYNLNEPLADPTFPNTQPDSTTSDNCFLWYFEDVPANGSASGVLDLVMPEFIPDLNQIISWEFDAWFYDLGTLWWSESTNFEYVVICGYDPNDKQVRPFRDSTHNYFVASDEEFEYVIRFQNTGTDTAFNIRVSDTLDQKLDWDSFQPLGASHDYSVQLDLNEGIVDFFFPDIMLPDSNVNLLGSQGYLIYRIRPQANLNEGDIIENRAGIYFDFNPPIITNTVFSTFTQCGTLDTILNMVVFPAPTIWQASICEGESIDWNGINYNEAGTYTQSFQTSEGCDSTVQLQLSVIEPAPPTTWEAEICTGESLEWNGITYAIAGTYTQTLQTAEGCDSLAELTLEVLENPYMTAFEIQDANANGNGSITPTIEGGTAPYTYLWSNGSTDPQVEDLLAGNYQLTVTDAAGCMANFEFEVLLNTNTIFIQASKPIISPNPLKPGELLNIQFPGKGENLVLELYNTVGLQIPINILNENNHHSQIKMPETKGIYWLVLKNLDNRWVQRILVQ